jgi:hypothetical protein
MPYINTNSLSLSWTTSRGRETYGYNICRLDSYATGKRYKTCGGGYDMTGTVLGDWLESEHQDKLQALFTRESANLQPYAATGWKFTPNFYGAFLRQDGTIRIDGACGQESIEKIAQACGIELQRTCNRKGQTTGWIASFEVQGSNNV